MVSDLSTSHGNLSDFVSYENGFLDCNCNSYNFFFKSFLFFRVFVVKNGFMDQAFSKWWSDNEKYF